MSELHIAVAIRMFQSAASRIDASAAELSRLDAVAGDGDHGVNMAAAFRDAADRLAAERPNSAADVFTTVGHSFGEKAGGSAGALFGALFGAMGGRLRRSPEPAARDFVEGLELAAERVALVGQTAAGSKTLLDALQPAAAAARTAVDAGGRLVDVVGAAATASEQGAAATADMYATAGRARHAPDGALGTIDPGALTVSIMFAAWAQAVESSDVP